MRPLLTQELRGETIRKSIQFMTFITSIKGIKGIAWRDNMPLRGVKQLACVSWLIVITGTGNKVLDPYTVFGQGGRRETCAKRAGNSKGTERKDNRIWKEVSRSQVFHVSDLKQIKPRSFLKTLLTSKCIIPFQRNILPITYSSSWMKQIFPLNQSIFLEGNFLFLQLWSLFETSAFLTFWRKMSPEVFILTSTYYV